MMEALTIVNDERMMQFQVRSGDELAYLEYRLHEGAIALMHTEVPGPLGGKGIATALAEYAFRYARERGLWVKVYCPFVAVWLKKHPEQLDIVIPRPD